MAVDRVLTFVKRLKTTAEGKVHFYTAWFQSEQSSPPSLWTSVGVKGFPSTDVEVDPACVTSLPAGQNANYIIGLVALDADGAVIKVRFRFLVTLPDGTNL